MHIHGGPWTDNKLEVMHRYFSAYAQALKNKPHPNRPFKRWYIDAFAGTGERSDTNTSLSKSTIPLFEDEDSEIKNAKDGSVRIALNINPPFDRYIFIDKSTSHIASLEKLKTEFSNHVIDLKLGDANIILRDIAIQTNWKSTRAAIFIDPYGMQVDWETLQLLAKTKSVDIALLFPTGPLNRMLARHGNIPTEWRAKIKSHLGNCDWQDVSYRTTKETDLFSQSEPKIEKTISTEGLRQFVFERLDSIFAFVCDQQLEMKNSRGAVLYHLFIICANDSGAAKVLAKKLAASALKSTKPIKAAVNGRII